MQDFVEIDQAEDQQQDKSSPPHFLNLFPPSVIHYRWDMSSYYTFTRKSNPFHRFFNGITPVCLQCFPALNISPLNDFTLFLPYLRTPVLKFSLPRSPLHKDLPTQDLLTWKHHDIAPTIWETSSPLPFPRALAPSLRPSFKSLSWGLQFSL